MHLLLRSPPPPQISVFLCHIWRLRIFRPRALGLCTHLTTICSYNDFLMSVWKRYSVLLFVFSINSASSVTLPPTIHIFVYSLHPDSLWFHQWANFRLHIRSSNIPLEVVFLQVVNGAVFCFPWFIPSPSGRSSAVAAATNLADLPSKASNFNKQTSSQIAPLLILT